MPAIKFNSSKRKTILLLFMCLTLTVLGWFMIEDGLMMAWLGIIFFGICALVMMINLVPGSSWVSLDELGFTMCSLFRQHRYAWSEVQNFGIIKIRHQKMVAFNFTLDYTGQEIGRLISKELSNYEAALPDTYGLTVERLLDLMIQYKNNYESKI